MCKSYGQKQGTEEEGARRRKEAKKEANRLEFHNAIISSGQLFEEVTSNVTMPLKNQAYMLYFSKKD